MIRAGIVGGTGYTGVELLRILALHPAVEVTAVTSRADAGQRVDKIYPSLRGYCNALFSLPELDNLLACDVVFFATPNGTAMTMAAELLDRGIKVIDLSADFRIKDVKEWEKWYAPRNWHPTESLNNGRENERNPDQMKEGITQSSQRPLEADAQIFDID